MLFGAEVFTQLSDKPEGETWLVVKPLRGKPKKLFKLSDGSKWADIQWRPGANEIILGGRDLLEEGDDREKIYTIPADGGTLEFLVDGKDFSVSRDGTKLAFVRTQYTSGRGNEGLFILDLDSGKDYKISDLKCTHPRWSKSSDELVFSAVYASERERNRYRKRRGLTYYYGDIYVFNATYAKVNQVTTDGIFEDPDFSPDATKVLASSYDAIRGKRKRSMVVIDRATGSWTVLLEPCDAYESFGSYDFMPDTGELVFEGKFKNPSIKRAKSRKDLKDYESKMVSDIFTIGLDGSGLKRLELDAPEYKSKPVFSPDGELFTYRIEYFDWNTEFFSVASSELGKNK
jgi:Tol biopolymer transport system component